MKYEAAIITLSDKGAQGLRKDTAGDAIDVILREHGWDVVYRTLLPDEQKVIQEKLCECVDEKTIPFIVTTGGTGFSKRDVTPEATLAVLEREVRGIPEAMRAESLKVTPMGMLSRGVAGIRGGSLIINLPGSEKAARECLQAVISPIRHGLDILAGTATDCANLHK